MNIANLDKVIAIVAKAAGSNSIYMPNIQSASSYRLIQGVDIPPNETEFFKRGNKANLMGLVAISDAWRLAPTNGGIDFVGEPHLEVTVAGNKVQHEPVRCMEDWLGITALTIGLLFYGYELNWEHELKNKTKFVHTYGTNWDKVTAVDVLRVLNELKTNGEIALIERVRNQVAAGNVSPYNYVGGVVLRFDGTLRVLKKEAGLWP